MAFIGTFKANEVVKIYTQYANDPTLVTLSIWNANTFSGTVPLTSTKLGGILGFYCMSFGMISANFTGGLTEGVTYCARIQATVDGVFVTNLFEFKYVNVTFIAPTVTEIQAALVNPASDGQLYKFQINENGRVAANTVEVLSKSLNTSGANGAFIKLRGIEIVNNSGDGVLIQSTNTDSSGLKCLGKRNGSGIIAQSSDPTGNGAGMKLIALGSGAGLRVTSQNGVDTDMELLTTIATDVLTLINAGLCTTEQSNYYWQTVLNRFAANEEIIQQKLTGANDELIEEMRYQRGVAEETINAAKQTVLDALSGYLAQGGTAQGLVADIVKLLRANKKLDLTTGVETVTEENTNDVLLTKEVLDKNGNLVTSTHQVPVEYKKVAE